jgi:hypothetical protein
MTGQPPAAVRQAALSVAKALEAASAMATAPMAEMGGSEWNLCMMDFV